MTLESHVHIAAVYTHTHTTHCVVPLRRCLVSLLAPAPWQIRVVADWARVDDKGLLYHYPTIINLVEASPTKEAFRSQVDYRSAPMGEEAMDLATIVRTQPRDRSVHQAKGRGSLHQGHSGKQCDLSVSNREFHVAGRCPLPHRRRTTLPLHRRSSLAGSVWESARGSMA